MAPPKKPSPREGEPQGGGPPRKAPRPVDEARVEAEATVEIARHWYRERHWLRLEAMLTDREAFRDLWIRCPNDELVEWWTALERETGCVAEHRLGDAWRRWDLDDGTAKGRGAARGTAMCLVTLLMDLGRSGNQTETLLRTAMRIDAEDEGDDSEVVGLHLEMLTRLLHARGDYWQAEQVGRRALAIAERVDGPRSWAASVRLNTLAGTFLERGEYAEATRLYRRSLSIAEECVGTLSDELVPVLDNLVGVLLASGDVDLAEPYARRLVSIVEGRGEPDPQAVCCYVRLLARVLERQGNRRDALVQWRRVVSLSTRYFGPEHPGTVKVQVELAERLLVTPRADEAEALLRAVLAVADKSPGFDEEMLATVLIGLGRLCSGQQRHAEAVPFLERALALMEASGGQGAGAEASGGEASAGGGTGVGINGGAGDGTSGGSGDASDDGDADEADDHSGLSLVLKELGEAYRETGRLDEAADRLMSAAAVLEGDEASTLLLRASILASVAEVRVLEGNADDARLFLGACIDLRRQHLPPGHAAITEAEARLAELEAGAGVGTVAEAR